MRNKTLAVIMMLGISVIFAGRCCACAGESTVAILDISPIFNANGVTNAVTLDASASYYTRPGGYIRTYIWDFGDGTSYSEAWPDADGITTHTYSNPGFYTITFTVDNSDDRLVSVASDFYVGAYKGWQNPVFVTPSQTIQNAVDGITDADAQNKPYIVVVPAGTRNECVVLKDGVSLCGHGKDSTIIQSGIPSGFTDDVFAPVSICSINKVNGSYTYHGGIYNLSSIASAVLHPTIEKVGFFIRCYGGAMEANNCYFAGIQDGAGGVNWKSLMPSTDRLTLTFSNCNFEGQLYGIDFYGSKGPITVTLNDCGLTAHAPSSSLGIWDAFPIAAVVFSFETTCTDILNLNRCALSAVNNKTPPDDNREVAGLVVRPSKTTVYAENSEFSAIKGSGNGAVSYGVHLTNRDNGSIYKTTAIAHLLGCTCNNVTPSHTKDLIADDYTDTYVNPPVYYYSIIYYDNNTNYSTSQGHILPEP